MTPDVALLINEEARRARKLHKPFPVNHPERASTILGEEFGEVCKAVLAATRPLEGDEAARNLLLKEVTREITHVAATCVMWLEEILAEAGRRKSEAAFAGSSPTAAKG